MSDEAALMEDGGTPATTAEPTPEQSVPEHAAAPAADLFPFSSATPAVVVVTVDAPAAVEAEAAAPGAKAPYVFKPSSSSSKVAPAAFEAKHVESEEDQHRRNAKANMMRKPRAQSVFARPFQQLTMIEFDKETYGAEWLPKEKRNFFMCSGVHFVWFLFNLLRLSNFDGKAHIPGALFWIRQAVMLGGLGIVFVTSGLLHVVGGMHSGYTRKICHLALFASSPLMLFLWPYKSGTASEARWTTLWTVWTSYVMFYLFIKPVRRRFTPALLCFRAIDREEDRPHTLEWLVSQGVAGMVALVAVMIFLARSAQGDDAHQRGTRLILVMIPILINGVGDGLAEPVGIRFGRHKYKTRALWYQGKCCSGSFTRSLEGSACVFICGVLVVGMFRLFYSDVQFAVAMGSIPAALTLAEAFSPHTWDTPFIFLIGGVIVCLIEALLPGCGSACVNKISFFGIH